MGAKYNRATVFYLTNNTELISCIALVIHLNTQYVSICIFVSV